MQYRNWDQPILPLLLVNDRISERANFSLTATTAYIACCRVSHENSNVPSGSTFEAGRKLYMGDRYLEVPDSWEDRHTEAPSDDTLSTSVSTQAGEETSEMSVVVNPYPLQAPVPFITDSPPTKRTKPTEGLHHQSLLVSFLIAGHSPGPPKKSHPPPDLPPPQTPSKKQRDLSIPSIQSSIKTFFSPTHYSLT